MKIVPVGIAGVAAAAGLLLSSHLAQAQEDEPQPIVSRAVSATVNYGNDAIFQPGKNAPDFDLLGVRPAAVLTITVQFPPELAGQTMIVEPLDGGTLTIPEGGFTVNADGNVIFQFQMSEFFGASRISVHQPDDSNFLHFWIVDPDHPENTPADLAGVY
jgi:hypothetical protein